MSVAAAERSLHNCITTPKWPQSRSQEWRPVHNLVIVFAVALPWLHQMGTSKTTSALPVLWSKRKNPRPHGATFWVGVFSTARGKSLTLAVAQLGASMAGRNGNRVLLKQTQRNVLKQPVLIAPNPSMSAVAPLFATAGLKELA